MAEETKAPKRLLNPRRLQSLLKRAHETLLADTRNPMLTPQERLAYLKAGATYAKLLGIADGRRRKDLKTAEAVRRTAETLFD